MDQQQQTEHSYKKSMIIISIVAIIAFVLLYFFVFSATVSKPFISKPLLGDGPVLVDNVNWLMNELGAYLLHDSTLSGEKSEIEFQINDTGEIFTVSVVKNMPSTSLGPALNPDMKIIANRDEFKQVYESSDIKKTAAELYNQGKVSVILMKNVDTLILKGYGTIYDKLT